MNKLHKALATPFYKIKGYYPVTIEGIPYKLDPYHINYWRNVGKMRWEPETFKILSTYLTTDSTYVDIGAWIGPTVIYAAKKCKKVICFEPDQTALKFLRWNIELNNLHNVTAFNLAIAEESGVMRMGSFGKLGDSMTSLLNCNETTEQGIDVITQSWNDFQKLSPTGPIDLLKIDIEGAEFKLLPSMKDYLAEYKPTLFLSTHSPFLEKKERIKNLQSLIDTLDMYDTCLDNNLNPIDFKTQASAEASERFHTYLFTCKK